MVLPASPSTAFCWSASVPCVVTYTCGTWSCEHCGFSQFIYCTLCLYCTGSLPRRWTWNGWICEQFTWHRKSMTERFSLEGLLQLLHWSTTEWRILYATWIAHEFTHFKFNDVAMSLYNIHGWCVLSAYTSYTHTSHTRTRTHTCTPLLLHNYTTNASGYNAGTHTVSGDCPLCLKPNSSHLSWGLRSCSLKRAVGCTHFEDTCMGRRRCRAEWHKWTIYRWFGVRLQTWYL